MPFAGYEDFAECVRQNQDKGNPEAYCGAIKHKVEDKAVNWPPLSDKAEPVRDPYAVATVVAERLGWSDFSEGSEGRRKRDEIAEAIEQTERKMLRKAALGDTVKELAVLVKSLCG